MKDRRKRTETEIVEEGGGKEEGGETNSMRTQVCRCYVCMCTKRMRCV